MIGRREPSRPKGVTIIARVRNASTAVAHRKKIPADVISRHEPSRPNGVTIIARVRNASTVAARHRRNDP